MNIKKNIQVGEKIISFETDDVIEGYTVEHIQTFCNDRRNPFHFACRQWYSYNVPQWFCSILTRILIQILV